MRADRTCVEALLLALAVLCAACAAGDGAQPAPRASAPTTAATVETAAAPATASPPVATAAPAGELVRVTRVIDGDTIEVALPDGVRVSLRYIGVDTPESVAPNRPVECLALEASSRNKELVEGQALALERDVSERDSFGRLLRYAYLPDGRMVNEVLVREGYARVSTYPPDVKHVDRLLAAEREARDANRGLWSACSGVGAAVPATAESSCPQGCISPPSGCVVKGNISQPGREKIYHVPGGEFYAATVINGSDGERWFCTEAEAIANGWRRSLR